MDIETLSEGLYDDSNGRVTSISILPGELSLDLECDDWSDSQRSRRPRRRRFTINCKKLLGSDLCVGSANAISVHRDHPLLLDRIGKQGSLYFSSRPLNAHQVYADTWDVLNEHYQGWAIPSQVIGRSPSSFHSLLNGGNGLLLSGPLSVLSSVQARIGTTLTTQLIETHISQASAVVLTVEDRFVICGEVEVAEHDSARLSVEQVSAIATTAVVRAGNDAGQFKAHPPRYEARRAQWRVFFDQVGPTVAKDGDIIVIINDHDGEACVLCTYSVGPCT